MDTEDTAANQKHENVQNPQVLLSTGVARKSALSRLRAAPACAETSSKLTMPISFWSSEEGLVQRSRSGVAECSERARSLR